MSFSGFAGFIQNKLDNGRWVSQDEIEELRISGFKIVGRNVVEMREVLNPVNNEVSMDDISNLSQDLSGYRSDIDFMVKVRDFLRGALDVPLQDPRTSQLGDAALLKYAQDRGFKTVDEFVSSVKSLSNAYEVGMQYRPYIRIVAQALATYVISGFIFGFGWFTGALSNLRLFDNLFNYWYNYAGDTWLETGKTTGGGTEYVGTYTIRYWRYHVDDGTVDGVVSNRDGWIKSKFGNYYIRKNLKYPGSQTWYDERYKSV